MEHIAGMAPLGIEYLVCFVTRSFEIRFVCGKQNLLKDVEEPSKCVYTGVFETPAMCTLERLRDFEASTLAPLREFMHEDL